MVFRPIAATKIYMQVIAQIHEALAAGELQPGQRLPPERELATTLGVSRGSVRQALGALEVLGVIHSRPGEGTFVSQSGRATLLAVLDELLAEETWNPIELFEPRRILEPEVAALAAERAEPEDVDQIARVLREAEERVARSQVAMEEDLAFHLAVARANHNEATFRLIQRLADLMQKKVWELYKRLALREEELHPHFMEHRRIFEAIRDRDPGGARRAMIDHLLQAEVRLRLVDAELRKHREE